MKNIRKVLLCAIALTNSNNYCTENSEEDFENNQPIVTHDPTCKDFTQESDPVYAANLLFKQCYLAQQSYIVPSSFSDVYDKNSQTYPICEYVQSLGTDVQPHLLSIRQALQTALAIVHEKLQVKTGYFGFIKRGYFTLMYSKVDLHAVAHALMQYDAHVSLLCLEPIAEKRIIENESHKNSSMILTAAVGILLATITWKIIAPYLWTVSSEKSDQSGGAKHVDDQMTGKSDGDDEDKDLPKLQEMVPQEPDTQDHVQDVVEKEITPPSEKKRTWAQFGIDLQNNAKKEWQGYYVYFNTHTGESNASDVEKIDDEDSDSDSNWAAEWERQNKEDEADRQARQAEGYKENIWSYFFKTCNWRDDHVVRESDDVDDISPSLQLSPRSRIKASQKQMDEYIAKEVVDELVDRVVEMQTQQQQTSTTGERFKAALFKLKKTTDGLAESVEQIRMQLTESSEDRSSASNESQPKESYDHGEVEEPAQVELKSMVSDADPRTFQLFMNRDDSPEEDAQVSTSGVEPISMQLTENSEDRSRASNESQPKESYDHGEVEEPAQVELESMVYDADPRTFQLFMNCDDSPGEDFQVSTSEKS